MKKILLTCECTTGLEIAFQQMGFELYKAEQPAQYRTAQDWLKIIDKFCTKKGIEGAFSFDFDPQLAEACQRKHIIYLSWLWDSPQGSLWSKEARYDTNYIFAFDRHQFETQRARGLENVFYLPLAADADKFENVIRQDAEKSRKKFGVDVSFVGNLYNDTAHNLYDQIKYIPPYIQGYLEGLMQAQRKIWGCDLLEEFIPDEIWAELKEYVKWDLGDRYESGYYEVCMRNIIGQKIAQLERMEMCSYLARHFQFCFYTTSDTSFDPQIVNKGGVNYVSEMPLIFHYSKINIHITSRSIPSGIPLRVLDVLACGGFLLSNYQPELAEYFIDGEDIVMYNNMQDLYEKIAYYLDHEEDRVRIARAGHEKVKKYFSYSHQLGILKEILEGKFSV